LLKLADFGLAKRVSGVARQLRSHSTHDHRLESFSDPDNAHLRNLEQKLTPKVVSLWYRPIELLLESSTYDEGVDLWGLGCIIAELLLGEPLLRGKNEMDQIQKIFTLLGPPTENNWPSLKTMPLILSRAVEIPTFHEWKRKIDNSRRGLGSLLDIFGDVLSIQGIELLSNFLRYDPSSRWRTDKAMESVWFKEQPLPTDCRAMPTFPLDKDVL
jgi:serine/threonine protein kinase